MILFQNNFFGKKMCAFQNAFSYGTCECARVSLFCVLKKIAGEIVGFLGEKNISKIGREEKGEGAKNIKA